MKSNSVTATVRLKGNPIEFTRLDLDQCFFDHHQFVVVIDHKTLNESEVFADPEEKLKLMGESLVIDLVEGEDTANSYTFIGIITDVKLQARGGVNGQILLIGKSNTVKLERGRMLQSYSRTSLDQIFTEVTEGLGGFEVSNSPRYTLGIPFSFQYYETDWAYLQRISKIYGETFFTDGFKLIFGKYEPKTVELVYDINLKDVELGSRLISNQFEQYYHEIDNTVQTEETPFEEQTFQGIASERADELNLMKKPMLPLEVPVVTKDSLVALTKMRKYSTVNNMVYLTGTTNTHKVTIGCLVSVKLPKEMNDMVLGTYRVIKVRHVVDEVGHFENYFEAIPSQTDYIPYRDIEMPVAQPMQATVTDDVDTEHGIGRLQVQFPFEGKACYHWLPTMTPEAGSGQGPGRGYVFLPEIGDEVIVTFMDGNPEKPFVMGSIFHKGNAETLGGGAGNHIKSITDKSGSTVILNDKDGSITIKDKNGSDSTITFDGKQNIVVSTDASITLVTGKSCLSMKADGTIDLTGVKITTNGEEFSKMLSGAAAFKAYAREGGLSRVRGTTIDLQGTSLVQVQSPANVSIKAKELDADGSKTAVYTGGLIKINS